MARAPGWLRTRERSFPAGVAVPVRLDCRGLGRSTARSPRCDGSFHRGRWLPRLLAFICRHMVSDRSNELIPELPQLGLAYSLNLE